jgi:hypothetical protein
VGFVADHELIGAPRDLIGVAREPGVGLDRDRVVAEWLLPVVDRVREATGVPFGRQISLELGDEQAAVGEDQDPEVASGFDEAGSGDRLARGRRMAEASGVRARIRPVKVGSPRRADHACIEVVVLLFQLD